MTLTAFLQLLSDRCALLKDDLTELETQRAEFARLPVETQRAIHRALVAQGEAATALHNAARVALAGSL